MKQPIDTAHDTFLCSICAHPILLGQRLTVLGKGQIRWKVLGSGQRLTKNIQFAHRSCERGKAAFKAALLGTGFRQEI